MSDITIWAQSAPGGQPTPTGVVAGPVPVPAVRNRRPVVVHPDPPPIIVGPP